MNYYRCSYLWWEDFRLLSISTISMLLRFSSSLFWCSLESIRVSMSSDDTRTSWVIVACSSLIMAADFLTLRVSKASLIVLVFAAICYSNWHILSAKSISESIRYCVDNSGNMPISCKNIFSTKEAVAAPLTSFYTDSSISRTCSHWKTEVTSAMDRSENSLNDGSTSSLVTLVKSWVRS
jgi:hypothetical protein